MSAIASATISPWNSGAIKGRRPSAPSVYPLLLSKLNFPYQHTHNLGQICTSAKRAKTCRLSARRNAKTMVASNENSYELPRNDNTEYLDEEDVVTFLDPPKELIPLDPSSYNPASYLWKKIEEIPEERRHRLLSLLNPRLISRVWEVAGTRYDNLVLMKKSASSLLSDSDSAGSPEFWKCQTSGAPLPIAWMNSFDKVLFCSGGETYGRLIGGYGLSGIIDSIAPLYFSIRQIDEVMSTEEPCDFAYEFGDGLLDIPEYPQGFPKPAKHPWPLDDQVVIYVRHVGPGVLVGQAWQEGNELGQVPKKLCDEILIVKDYFVSSDKE